MTDDGLTLLYDKKTAETKTAPSSFRLGRFLCLLFQNNASYMNFFMQEYGSRFLEFFY